MSFSSLKADVEIMRSQNKTEFTNYDDEELEELNYTSAVNILKSDIISQIALKETDLDSLLDEFAVNYVSTLSMALTYKQLEIYWFERQDGGIDSMSVVRMDYYAKLYKLLAVTFKTFTTTSDKKRSKTITLRIG
jgi:hypothetical protein